MIDRLRTSAGLDLVLEQEGPSEAPTVVLLHGGTQSRTSWLRTANRLVRAGYRTLRFDARGHGDSDWAADGDYRIAAMRRDLADVTRGLDPARTALVGASMGGIVALDLAIGQRRPPFAALVLVDIVLRTAAAGGVQLLRFLTGGRAGFANAAEAVDLVSTCFPDRRRPSEISLRTSLRTAQDGRLHWRWDPLLAGPMDRPFLPDFSPVENRLRANGVASPTLLIRGGGSDVVHEDGVRHLSAILPGLAVATVPGAGHMVAGEDNARFSSQLIDFLRHHLPPQHPGTATA